MLLLLAVACKVWSHEASKGIGFPEGLKQSTKLILVGERVERPHRIRWVV